MKLILMTLEKFNTLDEMEQWEAIWDESIYIMDHLEGEFRVAIYKFKTFYVELYYHIEHNALKKLRTIDINEVTGPFPLLN